MTKKHILVGLTVLVWLIGGYLLLQGDGESRPDEAGGSAVRPAASQKIQDASLTGTYWKLVAIGDKPVDMKFEDWGREPHIIFPAGEGERATGNGGCNNFRIAYTLDGKNLSFGRLLITRSFCDRGSHTENAFVKAIEQTSRWSIKGDALTFRDDKNNVLATFDERISIDRE